MQRTGLRAFCESKWEIGKCPSVASNVKMKMSQTRSEETENFDKGFLSQSSVVSIVLFRTFHAFCSIVVI